MKNIVKQILESATKEWVKYQKRKMYREMIVGIKLKKLSKEEKEDINSRSRASYICSLYSDVWRD